MQSSVSSCPTPPQPSTMGFKIINSIGISLCALFLVPFIITTTLLVNLYMNPEIPPNFLGYTPLIVETGSMSPFFNGGDLVVVKSDQVSMAYGTGDVVCFKSGDSYITHRIIETKTDDKGQLSYVTQGDANNTPDVDLVAPEQILGTYKFHLPELGAFAIFMQTPNGMVSCVILPLVIVIVLFWISGKWKVIKNKKKATSNLPN